MATAAAEAHTWHVTSAEDAAARLGVVVREGLSTAEAGRRLEHDGPNRLATIACLVVSLAFSLCRLITATSGNRNRNKGFAGLGHRVHARLPDDQLDSGPARERAPSTTPAS